MANIGKVWKDETARISKRETRSLLSKPIRNLWVLRREMASLKKRIAVLEKAGSAGPAAIPVPAGHPEVLGARTRYTARGIRALRWKLGLSQAEFGQRVGVSSQAVYNWERKNPRKELAMRGRSMDALARVQGLVRREARAQALKSVAPPAARPEKSGRKTRKGIRHAS